MAPIDSVLEQVREHYLSGYTDAARNYKNIYTPSAAEVLLELPSRDDKPYPYRLYRADLMSGAVDPPNLTEFNHDSHLTFEPVQALVSGRLSVTLSPISWNAVEFESQCYDPQSNLLTEWALKWIDVEENNTQNEIGFGGYVHSITYPEEKNGKCIISVDFGSASTDSVYELINVFLGLGVTNLAIHSKSYHE